MKRDGIITGKSACAGIAKLIDAARDKQSKIELLESVKSAVVEYVQTAVVVDPDDEIQLTLPWPPSMNAYWGLRITRTGQRIMVVTKQGTKYQKLVAGLVAMRWRRPPIDYYVAVLIEGWAPSDDYAPGGRWFYDCDNRIKPTQDALAKAGVFVDDKFIRDIRFVDRGVEPPGRVVVSIRRFRGY